MPPPLGPGEQVLLHSILTGFTLSIWTGAALSTGTGAGDGDRRSRQALARSRLIPPRWDAITMEAWAAVLREVIGQVWPRWAAIRAAALLTDRADAPWTLSRLAEEVQCRARPLDGEFRRRFGMHPREYLTRVRVRKAVDLLRDGMKVECVPSAVGYKSRKNLNRALRRLTGMQPSQLPRLTPVQLDRVRQRLALPAGGV